MDNRNLASLVVEAWRARPSSERTRESLRSSVYAYAARYPETDPATAWDVACATLYRHETAGW